MGRKKDKAAKTAKIPKRVGGFKLPKEVRRKGDALLARAASPEGQAALAKGLTVAASLATAAAERSKRAHAAVSPGPGESAEGAAGAGPSPTPPVDPAKVVEAVQTVANEVLGRLFGGKKA